MRPDIEDITEFSKSLIEGKIYSSVTISFP